jgi:putative SOS response-associated peptidase YedK
MCAHYTLTLEHARLVIAGLVHIFAFAPRYNIGPAQRVPVILDTAEGVKAVEMRWGIRSGGDAPSPKGGGDTSSP